MLELKPPAGGHQNCPAVFSVTRSANERQSSERVLFCYQHGRLCVWVYVQGRKQRRHVLSVFLSSEWGRGRWGAAGVMMLSSFSLWAGHGWAHTLYLPSSRCRLNNGAISSGGGVLWREGGLSIKPGDASQTLNGSFFYYFNAKNHRCLSECCQYPTSIHLLFVSSKLGDVGGVYWGRNTPGHLNSLNEVFGCWYVYKDLRSELHLH